MYLDLLTTCPCPIVVRDPPQVEHPQPQFEPWTPAIRQPGLWCDSSSPNFIYNFHFCLYYFPYIIKPSFFRDFNDVPCHNKSETLHEWSIPNCSSNPGPLHSGNQGSGVTPRHQISLTIFIFYFYI